MKKDENTFFHIRYIVLCDHFGDIGFTDCVIGMEEKVREKKREPEKYGKINNKVMSAHFQQLYRWKIKV